MKSPYQGASVKFPFFGHIPLSPSEILTDLKKKEDSPLWSQFFKYLVFGFCGLGIFLGIFAGVDSLWPDYLKRELLENITYQLRMSLVLGIAFIPSSLFSYYTNRAFVFTPGKHGFPKEFSLFMLTSAISFIGGELGKQGMTAMGYPNFIAAISFAISSVLINFVARKLFVFK